MQKKWSIVLMIVNIACLLAVTTVSVVVWAVNNSKTVKSDKSTVTVIGEDVSATMSAGKQVDGESSGIIDDATEVENLSSFTIGDITVSAGGYVNVWFTVENLSTDTALNVAVLLTNGADGVFSNANVTTEIYDAYWDGDMHITDIDNFLTGLNEALNTPSQVETGLVAHDIMAAESGTVTIPKGGKKSIIVRYDIGASAVNFDIGINLTFSV